MASSGDLVVYNVVQPPVMQWRYREGIGMELRNQRHQASQEDRQQQAQNGRLGRGQGGSQCVEVNFIPGNWAAEGERSDERMAVHI